MKVVGENQKEQIAICSVGWKRLHWKEYLEFGVRELCA